MEGKAGEDVWNRRYVDREACGEGESGGGCEQSVCGGRTMRRGRCVEGKTCRGEMCTEGTM